MLSRSHSNLDEAALRNQLGQAKLKISSLEDYIQQREMAFQAAVSSMRGERRDSQLALSAAQTQRVRRVGITGDGLLNFNRNIGSGDTRQETDLLEQPLGQFVLLRLTNLLEREDGTPMPFLLRRLVGRCYHIDPEGAIIGSDPSCSVVLPLETEVLPMHCSLHLEEESGSTQNFREESQQKESVKRIGVSGKGHFVLKDLTEGRGDLHVSSDTPISTHAVTEGMSIDSDQEGLLSRSDGIAASGSCEPASGVTFPMVLRRGLKFVTGRIEWTLSALPAADMLLAKAFYLASQRDLPALRELLEFTSQPCPPALTVTGADGAVLFDQRTFFSSSFGVPMVAMDVNAEYSPPSYQKDEYLNILFSSRKGAKASSPPPHLVTPATTSVERPRLLLHVAIENDHPEMVEYLLIRGADVNKVAGELKRSAIHLAAKKNSPELVSLLLKHGADIEQRDAEHLTPLALTTSYEVQKMLLNSVLLCAAADAGVVDDVARLLAEAISPNARGLRHRSALHCAASSNRPEVVHLLLMNGADVDLVGGSRQRTALHYASAGGHGEVVQLLLTAGANEFARDSGGYTALNICRGNACKLLHRQPLSLCLAVQTGDIENVREKLKELDQSGDMGPEDRINLRNEQNHAPLHLACILGSLYTPGCQE